jgi:putative ABC transport system ATP-binding protein
VSTIVETDTDVVDADALPDHAWGAVETIRHGWRASPELREGMALTIVLAFIGTGGRLTVPILIQQAIDKGFVDGEVDVTRIERLAVIAAVAIVVSTFAMRAAAARLAVQSERALYSLRTRAFAHIHGFELAEHAEERRGALVARVTSDVETLSQFFAWGGLAWLLDGVLIVVTAGVMLVFDWRLALVAFAVSLPLVPMLRFVQSRLVRAYGVVRERNADLLAAVSEMVMGAGVVRAYAAQQRVDRVVRRATRRYRDSAIRANSIAAALFPSGDLFSVLTVAAVVLVGLWIGPGGGLTVGALVGFVFLTYRFLEPIAEVTEILDQTQTAVAGWRRVLATLDRPHTILDPDDGVTLRRQPPSIEVRDLTYRYRPRPGQDVADVQPALRHVSFRIEPSTAVAVVGATGSGKTTLAKLLTRLADPDEGQVLLDGVDLRDVSFASLRSMMVMVPQEPFLFDTTIATNVHFGLPDASLADIELAFCELGLESWLTTLPDGIYTRVGERGEQLSAGERQLVALARAYVANPRCLVLDEATSSVDALTETRLARALESLARGRTSVTIAHRLSTASRADRILVFDQGRLVEDGDHDSLLAAGGVYAALYASWLDATAASGSAETGAVATESTV